MPVQILESAEPTTRKSDYLASFLGNMINSGVKATQDKQLRQAAAKMLGIPEDQIPLGISAQDVMDLQKEKLKPQEWKPKSLEEAISFEKEKESAKSATEGSLLKQILGIGGTENTPVASGQPVDPNQSVAPGGAMGSYRPEEFTIGGVKFKKNLTPEEQEQARKEKIEASPFYQNAKAKRTEDLINTIETNKVKRDMIQQARDATKNIDTGWIGRLSMWWKRGADPDNPMLEEWQKIKMVLTDAQLMNTAKTKGAISDKEMALFSKAAANDDIASIAAMKPVFNKLVRFIDTEDKTKIESYKRSYGEDLSSLLGKDEGQNFRQQYNALRASGMSAEEARKQLGF